MIYAFLFLLPFTTTLMGLSGKSHADVGSVFDRRSVAICSFSFIECCNSSTLGNGDEEVRKLREMKDCSVVRGGCRRLGEGRWGEEKDEKDEARQETGREGL